jgi:malic enzyme
MAIQTADQIKGLGHTTDPSDSMGEVGCHHASDGVVDAFKNKGAHKGLEGGHPMLSPALAYHAFPVPGKFSTVPSKRLTGGSDLSLAYSPGVAEACQVIEKNPEMASLYTMRQHLVGVISNGTAVLGLGNIGALASKPVMEGKAVLFQFFSGLNAIDLEIDEQDPDKLIDTIVRLAPSFGAINLEDIKAPECFYIESELKKRLNIPVFHDDQHGTAITVSAAILNALELVGKTIETSRCVIAGAGAGALACAQLLLELGLSPSNLMVCDTKGVIHAQRDDLSSYKRSYARDTHHRSLSEALNGADIFLGLSGPNSVTPQMIMGMAQNPIIFALANPIPEIWPSDVLGVRPDAYVGTGRSDLPNQVNNVLCFPYIFRGAMDAGAQSITLDMKKACVRALSGLAKEGFVDLTGAYDGQIQDFGPQYFLPKPFDHRLSVHLPLAVARAAVETGQVPVFDLDYYRACLIGRAYKDFLAFKTLLARSMPSQGRAPRLGYAIETDSGRVPHAVCAAARLIQHYGLADVYLIGNGDIITDQLKDDSVLSNVSVYDLSDLQQGRVSQVLGTQPQHSAGVIRILSAAEGERTHRAHDQYVSGWRHGEKLHLYSLSAPTDQIKVLLETCGCRLLAGFDECHGQTRDSGTRPSDSGAGASAAFFDPSVPHFGGLAAHNVLDAVWHIGTPSASLGDPWFGPVPLSAPMNSVVTEHNGVRYATELSCWTLLMQENSV